MKKQLNNYYREIRSYLPCSEKLKKSILSRLEETVNSYLDENPEADFTQLESHFGTPRQIADSYIGELSVTEISEKLQIRKRILITICAVCAAILAIWLIVVGIAMINELGAANGHIIEGDAITETT